MGRSNDNGANNNKDNNKKGEGSKKETSATVSLADAQKQWNQQIKQKQKALQKTARPQQQGQQVLRRGHWTPEEEVYAEKLIQEFKSGLLPLPAGTSLRTYLATLLNCDPMRISKKFEGPNCIGKQKTTKKENGNDYSSLQKKQKQSTKKKSLLSSSSLSLSLSLSP